MKLWNILYETPDMTEERHVKAPTMAEAMKKVLPDDTYNCWGQEVEDMSLSIRAHLGKLRNSFRAVFFCVYT